MPNTQPKSDDNLTKSDDNLTKFEENPYDNIGNLKETYANNGKTISKQILEHIKKTNVFDTNRVNSIHHGTVAYTISQSNLIFRELTIQDHLKKHSLPEKPKPYSTLLQQIYETIANNSVIYNDVPNGVILFFVRNWKIYKQEIHKSEINIFDKNNNHNSF